MFIFDESRTTKAVENEKYNQGMKSRINFQFSKAKKSQIKKESK